MSVLVSDVSKRTGDYVSLSANDLKLMALALKLERQYIGSSHIRLKPELKVNYLQFILEFSWHCMVYRQAPLRPREHRHGVKLWAIFIPKH